MKGFFCSVYSLGRPEYFFIGSAIFAALLWLSGNENGAILFTVSFAITFGFVGLLKILYRTPRPKNPMIVTHGYAFPSGHAAGAAFLTVVLYYLSNQSFNETFAVAVGILFGVITVIIATSRVFLRAHTTFQVFTGLVIGLLIPIIVLLNQTTFL